MISPNHLYLKEVNEILLKTNIEVIAQNLTSSKSTSDTGGITAVNLRNLNVNRSIIAHSEARIRQKNPQDVLNEIIPMGFQFVLCFEEIDQIPLDLLTNDFEIILAYEPVWAIGTGLSANPSQAQEMHNFIREKFKVKFSKSISDNLTIIYGGSVKPETAKDIFDQPDVDGGLIGGASLNHNDFIKIVKSIT